MPRLLQPGAGADRGRVHLRQAHTGHRVRRPHALCGEGNGMKQPAVEIRIGLGSCGVASGGEVVRTALEQAVGARATVKTVGCNGMCHCEPMVEVVESGGGTTLYGNVTAESARRIEIGRASCRERG